MSDTSVNDVTNMVDKEECGLTVHENKGESSKQLMPHIIEDEIRKRIHGDCKVKRVIITDDVTKKRVYSLVTQEKFAYQNFFKHKQSSRRARSRRCHWFMAWGDSLL
ncbi:hypothetical protein [Pantoea agglomerans]|uniref:hypothetical protein n=1 Tax=Enterobacter agglomerans TaxID=549 RepID=UPI000DAE427A|nr:hypothetical protein [Pantoea agglomerans]RAH27338.1 hypothetical protein DOT37_21225 [Pantoea agglomerans]TGX89207.1 hypothetical protein E5821_20045 [Pantoea agglomerans]